MRAWIRFLAAFALLGASGWHSLEGARTTKRKPTAKKPARLASRLEPVRVSIIQNADALAPFFKALDQLEVPGSSARTVRIMHYGDSHTAADYWTGRLRQRFQMAHGNGGQGLLLPARPWRGYRHEGVSLEFRASWPGVSLRGRIPEPQVGLTGAALAIPEGQRLELKGNFGPFRVQALGEAPRLDVVPWDPSDHGTAGSLPPLPVASATLEPAPLPPVQDTVVPVGTNTLHLQRQDALPFGSYRLAIALPPGSRLLGVDLASGQPGVIYDELGLNGGEFLDLEAWDPALRKALLGEAAPALVVLAYGTNEAGHPALDLADYRARVARLLKAMRTEVPGAAFLVVGPPDRSARRKKQMLVLKERVPATVRALREAALEAGCAFWDARAAMGGEGAMARWRKQGLARNDLVHFAGAGYARLGDLLYAALMEARPPKVTP